MFLRCSDPFPGALAPSVKDLILRANRMVEWVTMDDGPMGSDDNDVLDWDGNNAEYSE